jgi:hypothetical protein
VVALAICGVALAAPPTRAASCGPPQARTLASSSQARVYVGHKGFLWGCAGKRQFRLGNRKRGCDPCVGRVVVPGTVAAYVSCFGGYDNTACAVIVRRLTDGKRLAAYAAAGGAEFQSVPSLVARSDGHVAWIGVGKGFSAGIAVRRDGTILDHGRTIDPHSLTLHGTLLSWKHGSETRHARLS